MNAHAQESAEFEPHNVISAWVIESGIDLDQFLLKHIEAPITDSREEMQPNRRNDVKSWSDLAS